MNKRVRFTRFELETILSALCAAEAGPTDWQDSQMNELGGEGDPKADAWMERSQTALETAADKVRTMLSRKGGA